MIKTNQIETVLKSHNFYKDKLEELKIESFSGRGSCLDTTEDVRHHLPIIINNFEIKSITDSPCGDWNWMRMVNLKNIDYIGYDVIEEVLNENKKKYESKNIKFEIKDIINDNLRKSDLIICRDFTFHISNENILKLIKNIKNSGSKYLLTTSFDYVIKNFDISKDSNEYGFRKINMKNLPFSLGEPIYGFYETHPENLGRTMYLWKL